MKNKLKYVQTNKRKGDREVNFSQILIVLNKNLAIYQKSTEKILGYAVEREQSDIALSTAWNV